MQTLPPQDETKGIEPQFTEPAQPIRKVVSIAGNAAPVEPDVEIKTYEAPTPFSPGPFTIKEDKYIFDKSGVQIGHVQGPGDSEANAGLFVAAWELFTMLHEYTTTDRCTGHRAGESCRFCVAQNVIRRATGTPADRFPMLTWFAQYQEQQEIVAGYKRLYEQEREKVNQVALDIQERMFTMQAGLERLKATNPVRAEAWANAIAELGVVKGVLEE